MAPGLASDAAEKGEPILWGPPRPGAPASLAAVPILNPREQCAEVILVLSGRGLSEDDLPVIALFGAEARPELHRLGGKGGIVQRLHGGGEQVYLLNLGLQAFDLALVAGPEKLG